MDVVAVESLALGHIRTLSACRRRRVRRGKEGAFGAEDKRYVPDV